MASARCRIMTLIAIVSISITCRHLISCPTLPMTKTFVHLTLNENHGPLMLRLGVCGVWVYGFERFRVEGSGFWLAKR